jgi:CHRD domain
LSGNVTAAHIHNGAVRQNGPVAKDADGNPIAFTTPLAPNVSGSIGVATFQLSQADVQQLEQGNYYIYIHTQSSLRVRSADR